MAQMGYGSNVVVRNWIEAAREDPLPEVRNAPDDEVGAITPT
jgi:hypothetical protein